MSHIALGPKKPVNMTLSEDLVHEEIVAVPQASLGSVVASLADDASNSSIINAIDAVITRAYG
jgi:hypothetical protein